MDTYIKKGLQWGLAGTLGMTILMLIGTALKLSPMPAPVPVALAKLILGDVPKPVLMITGMLSHFLYGGIAGIIFSKFLKEKVSIVKGLAWGAILWLAMQLIFLPILCWGIFGTNISAKIAVVTLVLHLIYGGILGGGIYWKQKQNE